MKAVRCAIYTRKSSEEGLEQGFNSLHAQREACAAYVLSQASEGWVLLPEVYDDGGLSGGTLERPALQRLLGDVADGKVDIIVVYKVDRLTRSLLDFAKLVEALDKAGTSFVSITQSFNTTTSMGRLTLNMLLSFAQFEREVTAERIRDKVAASKAKGMWMGGIPPLGYRPDGRTLAIVEEHAALVREIHARYLALGNVRSVAESLAAERIRVPKRRTGTGRAFSGTAFSRGQIYAILRNPIYVGDIPHRGSVFQGLHAPILERAAWNKVQQQLAGNVRGERTGRTDSEGFLTGRIVDGESQPLLATHARKGDRRYRYYVSKALLEGTARSGTAGMRLPAEEAEQVVQQELAALLDDPLALAERAGCAVPPDTLTPLLARGQELAASFRNGSSATITALLDQVTIHDSRIEIALSVPALANVLGLTAPEGASPTLTITREMRLTRTGRAVRLVHGSGAAATAQGADITLIRLIAKAREWWARMTAGNLDPSTLAAQEGVSVSYVVRVLRIAFLAPAVVDAVLDGRLRAGVDSTALLDIRAIVPDWQKQERACMLRG